MKSNIKKIIIWVGVSVALIVVGYMAYKFLIGYVIKRIMQGMVVGVGKEIGGVFK
ncbi:hypothetical protein KAU11_00585 [Candidatus Babeliales bacterium]|nr:hypothetical protein [Candidatus Babeliales bacterium]